MKADRVLVSGKIITVDNSIQEAVVIKDGRILAVGSAIHSI